MEERTNVYEKIVERLTAMLGAKDYTEATAFADLGMKSVNYSSMINVLEDEFDVEISMADLEPENFNSAQAIFEFIQSLK